MSKLNDSTLKIFKKYRLNTDMSVFGNENKLYDVVKVMDDMVGGQVSKYKAYVPYASSIATKKYYSFYVQDSSLFTTSTKITLDISSPNILIIVDAKSYKVLSITEKPNTICIGYLQGTTKILGYVCYDIKNKNFGVYSDISGTHILTGTKCDEDFGFIPFVLFSSNIIGLVTDKMPIKSLITNGGSVTNGFTYSSFVSGDITLPKEVISLLPQGYCGFLNKGSELGIECTTQYTATEVEYDI